MSSGLKGYLQNQMKYPAAQLAQAPVQTYAQVATPTVPPTPPTAAASSSNTQQPNPAMAAAHQAAACAAADCNDPTAAAQAYLMAMKSLGFGMMCFPGGGKAKVPRCTDFPPGTCPVAALVDSMASLFIVNDRKHLARVTNASPNVTIQTADGDVPVNAIGDVYMYVRLADGAWRCFEVRNVLLVERCPQVLYSTRVMRDVYKFKHDVDDCCIYVPRIGDMPRDTARIADDGACFSVDVAFAGAPPNQYHRHRDGVGPLQGGYMARAYATTFIANAAGSPAPVHTECAASGPELVGMPAAATSGTSQSTLYARLGYPYEAQWRHVPSATVDHGLPPNAVPSTSMRMSQAVTRGRARAVPFTHTKPEAEDRPAPGAKFFMDFAGPMVASHPHAFTSYCGIVDAGSGYGRVFPVHGMTAAAASATLEVFTADVAAKLGLTTPFKPTVVRSDQGSAFVSHHFREFLSARQIQLSLAAVYTPQQNSVIENMWGIVFGTARVLLAGANLPPTFHPYASQTAAWLMNRIPRPSLGNQSPYTLLSRLPPSLAHLRTFGCLCEFTLHAAWREGDKHFGDRGEYGIYLGPSEESPASVVYQPSSRKLRVVPGVRAWEDQFPGLRGDTFNWFPDSGEPISLVAPLEHVTVAPPDYVRAATDNEQDKFMRSCGYSDEQVQQFGRAIADAQNGTHAAPSTPRRQPLPPTPTPPATSTPAAPSTEGHAAPTVRPMLSLEGNATAIPEHSDPSSRLFKRPARARVQRQALLPCDVAPSLSSGGKAAIATALMLCAFAAIESPDAPALDMPSFVFSSEVGSLDDAFSSYDSSNESCLFNAFVAAVPVVTYHVAFPATSTMTNELGAVDIPKSYTKALASNHSEYWREAIAKELAGLVSMHTWTPVRRSELPSTANVMFCHYVFAVKRLRTGAIEKFKARLVANGNTQKYGVDFEDVFSAVVKTLTIRLVLVVAAARDYNLSAIDIRQAYLQAEVHEDLYMHVPQGLPNKDTNGNPIVYKLNRSLYGLKQAGRMWAKLFADFLVEWGFARSTIDTCLFIYARDGLVMWCLVYVDDALIADNDPKLRARFVKELGARFPTEDKGELAWILGVSVDRDRAARTITVSQKLYVADLLVKYADFVGNINRSYDTPLPEGALLSRDDSPVLDSREYLEMTPRRSIYMALVGSLLWLANMTCYQITFAASQLARFLSNPGEVHFNFAIRVLVYLRDHSDTGLVYKPNVQRGFETYVDSSWAAKFSCSGAFYMFYGCPFHWFSKTQKSVTLSSAEAEYFGAMMATRDALFVLEIMIDLGLDASSPLHLFCDSKSAVALAFNPVAFKNTKHILRAAYFLQDLVARGVTDMKHVAGAVMIADILTKAPARQVLLELLQLIAAYAKDGIVVADV